MQHPKEFYIAHAVHSGRAFPSGPVWGALTDGPEDRDQVIARICDGFPEADLGTLRVWRFQDDVPARDVTDDILAEVSALQVEPSEDDTDHENQERHSWEQV
jgi:hypothetical protein